MFYISKDGCRCICTATARDMAGRHTESLTTLPGVLIPRVFGEVLKRKQEEVAAAEDEGRWRGFFQGVSYLMQHGDYPPQTISNLTVAMGLVHVHDKASLKYFREKARKHMEPNQFARYMNDMLARKTCQDILVAQLDAD